MKLINIAFVCLITCAFSQKVFSSDNVYNVKDSADIQWGPNTNACRFAILTDKQVYAIDEPVRVCLIIQYVGDKYTVVERDINGHRFDIILPNGKTSSPTLKTKKLAKKRSLRPDVIKLMHCEINVWYIPSLNSLFDITIAGEYRIRATRLVGDIQNNKLVEVPSNTIKIRILDEAKESDASKVFDKIIEKRPKPKKEKVAPKNKERELKTNKKGEIMEI